MPALGHQGMPFRVDLAWRKCVMEGECERDIKEIYMKEGNKGAESETPAVDLRSRAEKKYRAEETQTRKALSPEETRQTLHELRVHQIELQMQNDELRRTQVELAAERARYFDLYDLAPVGYITVNEQEMILEANLTAATLLGVSRDALVRQPISQFILDEDQDIYYLYRKQIFETHLTSSRQAGGQQACELRMLKKDGPAFWVHLVATTAQDPSTNSGQAHDGAPVCRIVMSDITEHKREEEEIRIQNERFSQVLNGLDALVYVVDMKTYEIVFINSYGQNIWGDIRGKICWQTIQTGYAGPCEFCTNDKLVGPDGKPTRGIVWDFQNTTNKRWYNCRDKAIYWPDGRIVRMETAFDITERKRAEEEKRILEERLQHADKMESIGTLAGGIAHDFNNLLTGIQGYASLTLLDLDPSHPHYERLRNIEEQVQSGADLTRQLLGFARGGRYDVKPSDMNDILRKSSSMFGRTKKEITIQRKYGKDLRPVEVDRGQMEQVFMNLYVNAWQAMPGGGKIYLETEDVLLDGEQAVPYAVAPGSYVKISVTDTGTGMDEKTRGRIFDPFFTTKEMGRGTGLGLATVYGIIKSHKGIIHVDSEPGQGTTFTIHLPASEKEVDKEKPAATEIMTGTETILLVDDEKMVLEVSRELLESMGYRIYAVGSGQEAIAVFMEKQKEIDLVILDMIMPGISGGETFDRLREIHPGVKVLLSSGYSIKGQAQEIMDRGCNGFLQKPFRLANLSRKVREMLD